MRIPCPYCGDRSNDEFVTLGDADALMARPVDADLSAFHHYAYIRRNPTGPLRELWYHRAGCRQWLIVTRDTQTHIVGDVKPARPPSRVAS